MLQRLQRFKSGSLVVFRQGKDRLVNRDVTRNRLATTVVSVIVVVFALAFYYTNGFGFLGIHPRESLAEYQWGELKLIANMIAAADSDEEGIEIAKRFNLCREDGTLDPENTKTMVFADKSGKQDLRIIGFRHDKVAGREAVYGITFCFVGSVDSGPFYDADWFAKGDTGWEASTLRSTVDDYVGTPPSYHDKFPVDLGRKIQAAEKSSTVENGGLGGKASSTADRVFVLSYEELFGAPNPLSGNDSSLGAASARAAQYQYFAEYFGKGKDGAFEEEAYPFWLRTSADGNELDYLAVVANGEVEQFAARETLKVIVGFCL